MARVDDGQGREPEVAQGDVHRLGNRRCVGKFDFETAPPLAADEQQVQFRSAVRRPEKRLPVAAPPQDVFDHAAFPRRARLGMGKQRFRRGDVQQAVQSPE